MQIVLLTFGGGGKKYYDSVSRLVSQAKTFNIFDKIIGMTDLDLQIKYPEFWSQHSNFISNNKRGFGYWVWKGFIILETIKTLNDGDLLVYLDCGCELNILGLERFKEYLELTKQHERMIFHLQDFHTELRWNKMDVIDAIGLKDDNRLKLPQAESGMQFYIKNQRNIDLLQDYYKYSCNYQLINDAPSILPNYREFVENRHDQSVLSLLFKRNNYFTIYDETWPETMMKDKFTNPIWAIRNYSSESKIK